MPDLPYRLFLTIVAIMLAMIFFFEIIDIVLEVGHMLFELLELLFEIVEYSLDQVVEHLFHTDTLTTQIIVFYILLFLFSLAAFFLWKKRPNLWLIIRNRWFAFWQANIDEFLDFWEPLSLVNKTLWVTGSIVVLYLLSFLLF